MNKRPLVSPADFASGFRKALPACPILLGLVGLIYFFALRSSFDYRIGHFDPSLLFGLLCASLIAGVLYAAVPAFLTKQAVSVTSVPADNVGSLFASVMGAVLAVILAVDSIRAFTPETTAVQKLEAFTLPFLALSLIFVLKEHPVRRIAAIISVISVNLTMFSCYFDPNIPINSPVRNLTVILQSSMLLVLLSEARLTFGTESWRITVPFYIFANGTASVLGGGIALGGLLSRLLTSDSADPNLPVLRLGLYLALAVLAASRLYALPAVCGEYREPPKKEKKPKEDGNPEDSKETEN